MGLAVEGVVVLLVAFFRTVGDYRIEGFFVFSHLQNAFRFSQGKIRRAHAVSDRFYSCVRVFCQGASRYWKSSEGLGADKDGVFLPLSDNGNDAERFSQSVWCADQVSGLYRFRCICSVPT